MPNIKSHAVENFNTGLSLLMSASVEMRRVLGTLFDIATYQGQGLKMALENADFSEGMQYKIDTVLLELEKHKKDIERLMHVLGIPKTTIKKDTGNRTGINER
jgi:hypothetical protein